MQKSYSAFNMNLLDQTQQYILWRKEHVVDPQSTSKSIPLLAKVVSNKGPPRESETMVHTERKNSLEDSYTNLKDLKRTVTIQT